MSFLDNLRKMVGMKPKDGEQTPKVKAEVGAEAFNTLSEKFFACENPEEKAKIWEQMRKALPRTLFLAAMCYEGENPNQPVTDRDLHASTGSKRLYAINQAVVTNGNPGYRMAKQKENRRTHLITMIYNKTKEEWVPLFTDFTKLLPVFGQKYRVMIISFDEARYMAKPYKGIVINPGREAIRLSADELKKTY
ncbi:MAG: SseB family protein [Clostridia bacterium]|nr:SseB family protein [Clostridia bacterium]